jgi:CDP-diacylglycerol--serine O-phosphatidyltransferase
MIGSRPDTEDTKSGSSERLSRRRAGIYLLPNLFTTGALFAGYYGIVAAINGRFEAAAIAVFVAMILDGIDGRIARLTNTQSEFGAQYDSLSDVISFGLAPSIIVYEWALFDLGKLGWLAAFMYTAGAALRLARFNSQNENSDGRFFQGLPSPAAAAVIGATVWLSQSFIAPNMTGVALGTMLITIVMALLMVSNLPYYSFKDLDLKDKVPFVSILAIVMVFVLVSIEPATVLFCIFSAYAFSGVVLKLKDRIAS